MNIAFIIHNQQGTGPYFKVLEQCVALSRENCNVTLFCTSPTNRLRQQSSVVDGVTVVEFPDALFGSLRQGVDLWNAFRRVLFSLGKKFDLVHAVDCRPNVILPALFIAKTKKIPLVLSWWDLFGGGGLASERSGRFYARTLGAVETFFEEYFRRFADGATVITSFLQKRLEAMNFPADRIIIHRVGCDSSTAVIPTDAARIMLGVEFDAPVLCFAGTMYHTDFAILREALDIVRKTRKFHIIWIGNFAIPSEVCAMYNIRHTGKLATMEEVYLYLSAVDICLLPMKTNITNKARWHSKVSDYFNAGKPVITTPVSDFPEIFAQNNVGWIADSDSPEDLAQAILTALDDKNWDKSGQNAKDFVRRELDTGVLARQLTAFYRRFVIT